MTFIGPGGTRYVTTNYRRVAAPAARLDEGDKFLDDVGAVLGSVWHRPDTQSGAVDVCRIRVRGPAGARVVHPARGDLRSDQHGDGLLVRAPPEADGRGQR